MTEPNSTLPSGEPENQKHEPLYTIAEVARYLQSSEDTVYRLMDRGDLPYVQFMRRGRRIVPADLRKFVVNRRRVKGKRKETHASAPSSGK